MALEAQIKGMQEQTDIHQFECPSYTGEMKGYKNKIKRLEDENEELKFTVLCKE